MLTALTDLWMPLANIIGPLQPLHGALVVLAMLVLASMAPIFFRR